MGYVMYVDSSRYGRDEHGPHGQDRRDSSAESGAERTPLGRAVSWVADKTLNTVLDSFLRIFLEGEWYVRLAGAIVTGVTAGSAVWLLSGTVLATLGLPTAAVAVGLGAAAGLVMGYGGGLVAGAGAGWLLSILAESVSTELSKDPLGLHFDGWVLWCLSVLVGGTVGWAVGRIAGTVRRRSVIAGRVISVLTCLVLFAATALVLIRAGASDALWSLADPTLATGPVSDALAVGVGLGAGCAMVAVLYVLWGYAPSEPLDHWLPDPGRFGRVQLPLCQAVVTAMLWTLAIVDSSAGSGVSVVALLSVAVWIVPWALVLLCGAAAVLWRRR